MAVVSAILIVVLMVGLLFEAHRCAVKESWIATLRTSIATGHKSTEVMSIVRKCA